MFVNGARIGCGVTGVVSSYTTLLKSELVTFFGFFIPENSSEDISVLKTLLFSRLMCYEMYFCSK